MRGGDAKPRRAARLTTTANPPLKRAGRARARSREAPYLTSSESAAFARLVRAFVPGFEFFAQVAQEAAR